MKYCISIDWLAFFCSSSKPFEQVEGGNTLFSALHWNYEKQNHGTRQFKNLYFVYFQRAKVAEVQSEPCSSILKPNSVIVKFENRLLYQPDLWDIVQRFIDDHSLTILNVSRIDICADFNRFYSYECVPFIADFLASRIRHKGKGIGTAHFNHYSKVENKVSKSRIDYTGLSFGGHDSDARVYLYNKTFELLTQKDKPYIRDFWIKAGLDLSRNVWRLEVSLKSKACKFEDKKTKNTIVVSKSAVEDSAELVKIYHTFVRKLFAFVRNREGITNISREPLLNIFGTTPPYYERGVIRNVSCSNRTTRILIKQLWQLTEQYRGAPDDLTQDEGLTKTLALELSKNTDLIEWFKLKRPTWEQKYLK